MDIDSCYRVGYVTKRHGLKGEVKIHLDVELPEKELESIFVEQDNRLIPFFIEALSVHSDTGILKLEDIDTPEQADTLLKKYAYLPKTAWPSSLLTESSQPDIIGFQIWAEKELIGEVRGINAFSLNPLIIAFNGEKEILIPFNDQFVKRIDISEKKIIVELPDGFLKI